MLDYIILYHTILYDTILCYTILCYIIPYYATLYDFILPCRTQARRPKAHLREDLQRQFRGS